MSNNYKVTSPPTSSAASSYQYNNYASGYPNYAYNGHEMTEYSRQVNFGDCPEAIAGENSGIVLLALCFLYS